MPTHHVVGCSLWILLHFSPCDVVLPQLWLTLVVGLSLGCGRQKECHRASAESHTLLEGAQPCKEVAILLYDIAGADTAHVL